jgi:DNA-binding NarL/FixJ family response regulator
MATTKELERIQKVIATPKMNKLISDRHDLHNDIKIELYKSGMTYRAIADLFTASGVKTSHETVGKVIRQAGVNRTQAPQTHAPVKPKTLEKEQSILDLRKQGLTQVAIASQLGISTVSVSRALKLNGLNTKQGYSDRFDIAAKKPQIIRLHNKGLSYKAIAEKLGISDKTVTKVMRSQVKTPLSIK